MTHVAHVAKVADNPLGGPEGTDPLTLWGSPHSTPGKGTLMAETMDPVAHVQRTIADLHATIDWLEEHEWIQGESLHLKDGSGVYEHENISPDQVSCACVFGALVIVCGELASDLTDRDRSSLASRAFYRIIGQDIVNYNDTIGRTKHQMIRALETVTSELAKDPGRA